MKLAMYYAEILVREFREPDRYQVIGPISGDDKDEIRENLERRGDDVVRIGTAAEMGVN